MNTDDIDERLDRLAAAAPPWTDEQRARLSALLRPLSTAPVQPTADRDLSTRRKAA